MPPRDGASGGATSHIKKGLRLFLSICLVKRQAPPRHGRDKYFKASFFFSSRRYRLMLYYPAPTAGSCRTSTKLISHLLRCLRLTGLWRGNATHRSRPYMVGKTLLVYADRGLQLECFLFKNQPVLLKKKKKPASLTAASPSIIKHSSTSLE